VTIIELQPLTKGDTVVPTPVILSETPTSIVIALAIPKVSLPDTNGSCECCWRQPGLTVRDRAGSRG
jgi:hypothetical protein